MVYVVVVFQLLSYVQLFETPWAVARQAPLSMGFSRQEYGVGCHALFQGTFLTQGTNTDLPHCRQILYHLSYQGIRREQGKWERSTGRKVKRAEVLHP